MVSVSFWAYLRILRPEISDMDIALPTAAAMLAAYVAHGSFPSVPLLALAVLGAYLATTSSYVLNDWCDVDIDRINLPHRPLPAGAISRSRALAYAVLLVVAASIIALYLNPESFVVLVIAVLAITFYSSHAKRTTPLSFVPVGIAYGLVPIGVWLAFDPAGILKSDGGILPLPAVLLGLMICITDWGFTLSGVCRDVEGDRQRGVPTTPVVYGIPLTSVFILVMWTAGVVLSLLIGITAKLGPLYLGTAGGVGVWMLAQCVDFVCHPVPERGGRLFLQGSRYRAVMFCSLIVDVVLCAVLPAYPPW
ncbi:MAG: UbiA prenyltransferase family protein [Methermicoccaceae archaeon]